MLTLDALKAYGANVEEGLVRCMGNEEFYLKLIRMMLEDKNFAALKDALAAHDLDRAFECAHAVKGVAANLALTPVFTPVSEMTELLRSRTDTDYSELYAQAEKAISDLKSMME